VDAPLRLGFRDPLDAVGAALELEDRVGAIAFDREGHLLETTGLRRRLREHLGREPTQLGVASEHFEEVAGEQRRLVAAGAGADLDDHVLGVVGVTLDHRQPDLLFQLLDPRRRLVDDPPQLLVLTLGEQLACPFEVVAERQVLVRQLAAPAAGRGTRGRPSA